VGLESGFAADSAFAAVDRIGVLRHLARIAEFSRLGSCGFRFGLLAVASCRSIDRRFAFSASAKEFMTIQRPNLAAGNGAVAFLLHIERLGRAVPEPHC